MKPESADAIARARAILEEAEYLLSGSYWAAAASRSYYAMFHAAKSVLNEMDVERSSHHAVIGTFGEFVVKPGLADRQLQKYLLDAFSLRSESDYTVPPPVTEERARNAAAYAKLFVVFCEKLLEQSP
ncbi:MAG TPA: HEPN domain-containing protein [Candidatus Brocadiia bacterium]|nr:HEPN domain-containing protein [Candidatus Brocadiia bacterium]